MTTAAVSTLLAFPSKSEPPFQRYPFQKKGIEEEEKRKK